MHELLQFVDKHAEGLEKFFVVAMILVFWAYTFKESK